MRAWWWIAVSCVGLWMGCGGAPPPPAPPRSSNLSLPVSAFRIQGNGLRVIVVRDVVATQVQVSMRYQVGRIDDPPDREGMAHLAEHVLFLPTLGGGQETLNSKLEAITSYFNAFTAPETTTYVSRGDPDRLTDLLQIEAMRLGLGCKTVSEEAFLREREVVRNELRERREDAPRLRGLYQALYPVGHPYRRPRGDESTVGKMTREEVCAFIEAHYSPDNAVLVVSGNVTFEAVDAALGKLLGRLARHSIAPRTGVPFTSQRPLATIVGDFDEPMTLVTWPLPSSFVDRAKARAVAQMMASYIDSQIAGTIHIVELGGDHAPVIGFAITAGSDETIAQALQSAEQAAGLMQIWFAPERFERARARGAYSLIAQFEDSVERDALLADRLLAGYNPWPSFIAEVEALGALSANEARDIVRNLFSFETATRVSFVPTAPPKPAARKPPGAPAPSARAPAAEPSAEGPANPRGERTPPRLDLDPKLHRPERVRTIATIAAAHEPAPPTTARALLGGVRERTLANGLRVVLMPLTNVPTVDIRLAFDAGTADEPDRQRGVALLAAHLLVPQRAERRALVMAFRAGGVLDVEAGTDLTTFSMRGLGMYVDVLLAALGRYVRGGDYPDRLLRELARARAAKVEGDPLIDAWRAALYGPDHPYTRAGVWHHLSADALTPRALQAFRDTRYRPGNATLIIAGGFDAALAERWIDYLFADWDGRVTVQRSTAAARLQPLSLATHVPGASQVKLFMALPVTGSRAEMLIAAEMIEAALADVRQQLGASYGIHAGLSEARLATRIHVVGAITADRAPEVLTLVRDRIDQLAVDDDVAAARFVAARRLVMARLATASAGATALADIAVSALELGRPAYGDLTDAEAARQLTLRRLLPLLSTFKLARAAIYLRGPAAHVTSAFAAVGRTPRVIDD